MTETIGTIERKDKDLISAIAVTVHKTLVCIQESCPDRHGFPVDTILIDGILEIDQLISLLKKAKGEIEKQSPELLEKTMSGTIEREISVRTRGQDCTCGETPCGCPF
jgi:hypothetical protein